MIWEKVKIIYYYYKSKFYKSIIISFLMKLEEIPQQNKEILESLFPPITTSSLSNSNKTNNKTTAKDNKI